MEIIIEKYTIENVFYAQLSGFLLVYAHSCNGFSIQAVKANGT